MKSPAILCPLAASCFLAASGFATPLQAGNDLPEAPREFRAAWIATVANIDWPSQRTLSTEEQIEELEAILDKTEEMNLNALIFQIRPMKDALYESDLEPWSEFLTGEMGKAPDPYYDPLEFMVEECRKRGLELHVWFNPYRARHASARSEIHPDHVSQTLPGVVHEYGNYLWMDPAAEETKAHTLEVVLDVVRRYDIDGVHIDDYFYPYPSYADGADFPDDKLWEAYLEDGGEMSRADWRRHHVDDFVERFYREVKEEDPTVKVGISPFGIWRPGYPEGISGLDQHNVLFADARRWLREGWVDYYTPQLYWPIDQTPQAYKRLLEWWVEQNHEGRNIWPGNYTNAVRGGDSGWPAEEIINQVRATREQEGATGNVHFSMRAFMEERGGFSVTLKEGVYDSPALVPASPWLGDTVPSKPEVVVRDESGEHVVHFRSPEDEAIRLWAVYTRSREAWNLTETMSAYETERGEFVVDSSDGIREVAVSAVDFLGNESPHAIVRLRR